MASVGVPMKAAIYARISQDRDGKALGVNRQLRDCRALCEQNGWEPVEFVDNDLTAADPRVVRPGYQAMLEAVKNGEVGAVIAWDLDRLTRQPAELEEFVRIADGAGLEHLRTLADTVNIGTGDGLMVARIKAAVAADEVAKSRKRLVSKKAELARNGQWNGGPLPYGRGPAMAINEAEAAVLREAAERVLAGESFRGVAKDLSDRGLGPRGKRWCGGSNLAQRLTNPHVGALRAHHADLIQAVWEPILDRNTWDALNALRADPSRKTRVGPPAQMLLTGGITRCANCGANLRARPRQDKTRRYGCPPGADRSHGGCGGVARDADEIDAFVVEAILTRLEKSDLPLSPDVQDVGGLGDELERIDAKLNGLADDYARDVLTRGEWHTARETLSDRRKKVTRRLETAHRSSAAASLAGRSARQLWELLDLDGKRSIIREMIPDGIVLASTGRGGWRNPVADVLTIGWFDDT